VRIWVYDLDRGTASPVTDEGGPSCLAWTPDGRRLVFSWQTGNHADLYWAAADGSLPMEQLTRSEYWQIPGSFSPDGSTLALVDYHLDRSPDILLLDLRTRRITPFGNVESYEIYPEFSPDGSWMAFVSMDRAGWKSMFDPIPVLERGGRSLMRVGCSRSGQETGNNCSIDGRPRCGSWMFRQMEALRPARHACSLLTRSAWRVTQSEATTSHSMARDC